MCWSQDYLYGHSHSLVMMEVSSALQEGRSCYDANPHSCACVQVWQTTYVVGGKADGSGSGLGWLQVVCFNPQSWDASLRFSNYFQDPVTAVTQYRCGPPQASRCALCGAPY